MLEMDRQILRINYSFRTYRYRILKPPENTACFDPRSQGGFWTVGKALRAGLYARVSTHDQKTLPDEGCVHHSGSPDKTTRYRRKADDSATPQRGALVLPFSYRPLIHHGHDRLPALMDMTVVRPVRITMTIVSARITHVRRAVCF